MDWHPQIYIIVSYSIWAWDWHPQIYIIFYFVFSPMEEEQQQQLLQQRLLRQLLQPSPIPVRPPPLRPIPFRPYLARLLLAKAFARWLILQAGKKAIARLTGLWLQYRAGLPPLPGPV